jgi:uncharacterized membrane protein
MRVGYRHLFIKLLPYLICLIFCVAYSTLSIVRHDNYQSFGYDLGINDQTVWRYANFQPPVTTIDPFPDKTKLVEHVELIYPMISPLYWIWNTRRMLLIAQATFFCISGIFVYLLAQRGKLSIILRLSLLIGYLGFYGVQNAMWADVHSSSFAAAFLMGFIYFLETKNKIPSIIFFFLAITAKENIGLLTFLISFLFFLRVRTKLLAGFMAVSIAYLLFIFYIYFPYIVNITYLYQNSGGLFSNHNILTFADSIEKKQVIWYSLLSYGFLPLLSPLYLIPAIADFGTYSVIANQLPGAQGLFGQYRITLVPLLSWATITTFAKYKWLSNWYMGVYLMICTLLVQYFLHLPLSYLTKSWFWQKPSGVKNIQSIITSSLPRDASVVAQNNIVPHISHRDKIYSIYPETKEFSSNSPCGKPTCNWFRWYGNPEYLFIDTSPEWDIRHLLTDRERFIDGLKNLEREKVITKYKQTGNAVLYKVNKNPESLD